MLLVVSHKYHLESYSCDNFFTYLARFNSFLSNAPVYLLLITSENLWGVKRENWEETGQYNSSAPGNCLELTYLSLDIICAIAFTYIFPGSLNRDAWHPIH